MEKNDNEFEKAEMYFSLKADISELGTLALRLEDFANKNGLPMKTLFELNLVLDELFTNLVNYGCHEVKKHYFNLYLNFSGKDILLVIEDNGKKFNPLEVPEPDIKCDCDERKIGGLGVHFMRKLMDGVEYSWENGINRLKLKKSIQA